MLLKVISLNLGKKRPVGTHGKISPMRKGPEKKFQLKKAFNYEAIKY